MKIRFMFFLLAFSCLITSARASSGDGFLHIAETSLAEEFEELRPELIDRINSTLSNRGLPSVGEEDVRLEDFFPYYMNARFFSPEIENAEDFINLIDAQEYYLWILPLQLGNYHVLEAVSRTHPVRKESRSFFTPEELEKLEAQEGKWGWAWAQYSEGVDNNWKAIALAQAPDADQIFLVNGLATTNSVMAVCVKDGELTDVISLSEAMFQVRESDAAALNSVCEIASQDGMIQLHRGDRFSYRELQQTLGRLVPDKSLIPGGGGGNFHIERPFPLPGVLLWLIPLAAIAAPVVIWQVRRRSRP